MESEIESQGDSTPFKFVRSMVFKRCRYLKIRFFQFLYRNKTNSPYLSGDSTASCVDYVAYGKNGKDAIDVNRLNEARSIFVEGHRFRELLANHGTEITAKVIVSGNSDENFVTPLALPESVTVLLSQNNALPTHPRIRTLPIGIENIRLGRSGRKVFHEEVSNFKIDDQILVPPMAPTNKTRIRVVEHALKQPDLFDVRQTYLSERTYFKMTKRYRFIFCCEGNGFDSHRIWEALYQNLFPVMLETPWSTSLKWLNLPILFVKNLEELNSDLLAQFLSANQNFRASDTEQLWVGFWHSLIKSESLATSFRRNTA